MSGAAGDPGIAGPVPPTPSGRAEPLTIWLALTGFLGMLAVSMLTVVDVLARWLFRAPIEGLEDIKSLAFGVLIAGTLPAVLLHGENVVIRFLGGFLEHAMGARARYWLEAFGGVIVLIFFCLLAWQFAVMTGELREVNDISITIGLKTWPWRAVTTAIICLCVPIQLVVVIGEIKRAITGKEPGGTVGPGGLHG